MSGLPDGLTVLHGANEAGKSTILEFLRRVLFGIASQSAASDYAPVNGGEHRGRIFVTNGAGEMLIERELDRVAPPVLRRPDGRLIDPGRECLARVRVGRPLHAGPHGDAQLDERHLARRQRPGRADRFAELLVGRDHRRIFEGEFAKRLRRLGLTGRIGCAHEYASSWRCRRGYGAPGARDDPALPGRDVHERDLRCREVVGRLLAGHGKLRPVGRPREAIDVEAALRERRRDRCARFALGSSAPRHWRIREPDLAPASSPRDEREPATVR